MILDNLTTAAHEHCYYVLDSIAWSALFFVLGYLACWIEVKYHNRRNPNSNRKAH